MQTQEINLGQVTYEISRVFVGTKTPGELIGERIETCSASIDRDGERAV